MDEKIIPFVPKNPAEVQERLLNIEIKELNNLVEQAGLGSPDEPLKFRTPEDFSSVELVSKWEGLLKELNTPIFIENEKQDYDSPYRLILEVNENLARDYLGAHYKYIMVLATPEERQEYIFAHRNLLLYIRRLKSFINNNPK